MAKKRGGVAGFYDRNKKIIKPVAAGLAGMLGTPALGAAVGAAFGGLDREGKGGIGFDAFGAAKGGIEGYGAGSVGRSLGSKLGVSQIGGLKSAGNRISGLFTGGGNAASTSAVSPLDNLTGAPQVGLTAGGPSSYGTMGSFQPTMAGGAAAMPGPAASASMYGNIPAPRVGAMPKIATQVPSRTGNRMADATKKIGSAAKSAGGVLERNQGALGGAAKGIGSVLGGRAEAAALESQTKLAREKFEYAQRQDAAEQERQARIAQLLLPMFGQMSGQMSGQASSSMAPTSFQQRMNLAADLGTTDPRVLREEQGEPIVVDGRIVGYQSRNPVYGNQRPQFQMGTIASRR